MDSASKRMDSPQSDVAALDLWVSEKVLMVVMKEIERAGAAEAKQETWVVASEVALVAASEVAWVATIAGA